MVSDSPINASIPNVAKDIGNKKKGKSAKWKKGKEVARQEQWLSLVKNKGVKGEGNGSGGEYQAPDTGMRGKLRCGFKNLDTRRSAEEETEVLIHQDSDVESSANSPTDSGSKSGNNFTGSSSNSSNSSSSSFSSGGSCSGNITEEEEGAGGGGGNGDDDDDDCVDDWEAVADALAAATNEKQPENPCADTSIQNDTVAMSELSTGSTHRVCSGMESLKTDCVGIASMGVPNNRAWRPDDAFRPQSLPNLTKQRSCPMNSEKHCIRGVNPWGRHKYISVPSSCPICCEDLDLTDSSFLPCSCGFRLCLFCHKRILEQDGRCPGCRKPYELSPVEKETSVSAGSLTIRLVRSNSMYSRA